MKYLFKVIKYTVYSIILIGTLYLILSQGIKKYIVNLPTIYHSLFFIFLGIWLWGINIHVLEYSNIDCSSLLTPMEERPLLTNNTSYVNYKNIYKLALGYTVFFALSTIIYNCGNHFWEKSTTEWIAVVTLFISLYTLFMPHRVLYKKERIKFVKALKRIVTPTFKIETSFNDVVLADLITSFSKVIGDIYVALAELFIEIVIVPLIGKKYDNVNLDSDGKSIKDISIHYHHHILLDIFGSFMILLPYLFRLRQCMADFFTKATKEQRIKSFLNALKYGSSIPVYILSGYYSWIKSDIKNTTEKKILEPLYENAKIVFICWIIASFINSAYSYYWDVFNDWELCKRRTNSEENFPILLRPFLHFSKPWTYYTVMMVDLILRFTWFVDVFPVFQLKNPFLVDDTPTVPEDIIKMQIEKLLLSRLLLRILEILRRWLWIFFRLEREWVYTNLEYTRIEEEDRNHKFIDSASISNENHVDIINSILIPKTFTQ
ncbi:EXS-domain-containing protein [Neocallimastix lanati (nom. inval.)]|jgi:hypothetical protein|nr:EXS-domain-containing protein [Neocallimastix sp. JGI-2020a]